MASIVFHTADGTRVVHTIECDACGEVIPAGGNVYIHNMSKMDFACAHCAEQDPNGYKHVIRLELGTE